MKILKSHKTFGGFTQFWSHNSESTKTEMKFSTYIPSGEIKGCLLWLSGLTCTEENFIMKAGAQKYLAETGLMVICPDTSPRGLNLPNEHVSYDFGSGASFYVDALTEGYKDYYQMYSYIVDEICSIIQQKFQQNNISISGHSMGGHGALMIGLKNPAKFISISAFAPIVNPIQCDLGIKNFTGYLGKDQSLWTQYDACELLKAGNKHTNTILIHQGLADESLERSLLTPHFERASQEYGQKAEIKYVEGYDHGYYFVSTFVEEHIKFHKQFLGDN
ncbi:MAG: S-formylglutathione hydrolase [Candidatus Melainabacteria bacterium]|jgi:S-formylglutathione hydrolase